MIFAETKKASPTINIKPINAALILQISLIGYSPYISLSNHTFMNTQQAPSPVQSSFFEPIKVASKKSQSSIGGIDLIKRKIANIDKIALNQFELIFLFKISRILIPLNSILIRCKP